MAISWTEGLLAGAAGIGEYALQQQAKRDARAERVQELRDQMELQRAKSEYSIKLNEYSSNRALHKQIKAAGADTVDGQYLLYKQLGMPDKAAYNAAQNAVKTGRLLKAPGELKLPEFLGNLDEQPRGRTQSWARDFIGVPGSSKVVEEAMQAPEQAPQEPQGPMEIPKTGVPMTAEEGQQVGAVAQPVSLEYQGSIEELKAEGTGFNPFDTPEKWNTKFQVVDMDGKRVLTAQQDTASGKTNFEVIKELGDEYRNDIKEIRNGDMTDIYAVRNDGTYDKIQSVPSASLSSTQGKDPATAATVSTADVDRFINSDNKLGGFNTTYGFLEKGLGDGWWNLASVDVPDEGAFKREVSTLHLSYLKNVTKDLTAREMATKGPQYQRDAIGHSLTNTLEPSDIAKLIDDTDATLDIRAFKNTEVSTLNDIIKDLTKLDRKSPALKELEAFRNLNLAKQEE